MKVAVRSSQHSPMFGQRASSQTEWRFHSVIRTFRRRYCGPPGARTLSHGGLGESVRRNGSRRGRETPIALILREFLGGIMTHLSQAANGERALSTSRRGRIGAEGGTRTPTGCPTRPSNVRVCQFRHFGSSEVEVCRGRAQLVNPSSVRTLGQFASPYFVASALAALNGTPTYA